MVSLLVWAHFSLVFLTGCTQKVPLFDLESPTRYSAFFFVIHETIVAFIHEFGHQRILAPIRKPEEFEPGFPPDLRSLDLVKFLSKRPGFP